MPGVKTSGVWIIDGACTQVTAYEPSMLEKGSLTKPGRGDGAMYDASGRRNLPGAVGTARFEIATDRGRWRSRPVKARLTSGFGVNLFPESVLVRDLGCRIEYTPESGKRLHTPDGGVATLQQRGGLHYNVAGRDDVAAVATVRATTGYYVGDLVEALLRGTVNADIALVTLEALFGMPAQPGDEQSAWVRLEALHELLGHADGRTMLQVCDDQGWGLTEQERAMPPPRNVSSVSGLAM